MNPPSTFNVDYRNQLTSATHSGTLTVAGTASEPRGDVWGDPGVTNDDVSVSDLAGGDAELHAETAPAYSTINFRATGGRLPPICQYQELARLRKIVG